MLPLQIIQHMYEKSLESSDIKCAPYIKGKFLALTTYVKVHLYMFVFAVYSC